jgi:predicted Zn-dependent peptidase
VDRIDKVTKTDIRRVANETFNDTNRTVGVIETSSGGARSSSDQGSSEQEGAR